MIAGGITFSLNVCIVVQTFALLLFFHCAHDNQGDFIIGIRIQEFNVIKAKVFGIGKGVSLRVYRKHLAGYAHSFKPLQIFCRVNPSPATDLGFRIILPNNWRGLGPIQFSSIHLESYFSVRGYLSM